MVRFSMLLLGLVAVCCIMAPIPPASGARVKSEHHAPPSRKGVKPPPQRGSATVAPRRRSPTNEHRPERVDASPNPGYGNRGLGNPDHVLVSAGGGGSTEGEDGVLLAKDLLHLIQGMDSYMNPTRVPTVASRNHAAQPGSLVPWGSPEGGSRRDSSPPPRAPVPEAKGYYSKEEEAAPGADWDGVWRPGNKKRLRGDGERAWIPSRGERENFPTVRMLGGGWIAAQSAKWNFEMTRALGMFRGRPSVYKVPSHMDCRGASRELLSVQESGGFFCDDDAAWWVKKRAAHHQSRYQERTVPTEMHVHLQQNWEPDFSCSFERRIGAPGDGGKWICDPHKLVEEKGCLVYSIGSNNEWSYESALLEEIGPHCEIHTFDNTVAEEDAKPPKGVSFHSVGLGRGGGGVRRRRRRKHHVAGPNEGALRAPREAHSRTESARVLKVDMTLDLESKVLKVDVEGAEYETLQPLLNSGSAFAALDVQQVQLEIHRAPPLEIHDLMRGFRSAGYAIFHKELNSEWMATPSDMAAEFSMVKLAPSFWD